MRHRQGVLERCLLCQTVHLFEQRYPPDGGMVRFLWRSGCLHGVNREILDPCLRHPGAEWDKAHPDPPKVCEAGQGQKTDFRDAIHIANLFRMDLVAASFIPPADIRDLRELCRYRLKLTYIRTSEKTGSRIP